MPDSALDPERYAQLLAQARPGIIEDPGEHDRLLSLAEQLMEKGPALSPEEEKLLALLVFLIEAFESAVEEEQDEDEALDHAAPPPAPHETLQRLLHARGLSPADIAPIFGNPFLAREALEGRRAISKGQAKQLGNFFQMSPKLFLP